MARVVLAGSAKDANVQLINFTTPANPSAELVPAGLGTGCTVDLSGPCGVIGSSGSGALRGINIVASGTSIWAQWGPVVSTPLPQIGAVAVRGTFAAAGQLSGGQVTLVDLAAATVIATVSTPLAAVGSVAFSEPTLVVATGPDDDIVAMIDFSELPPSLAFFCPGLGSSLTVAGDAGLAVVGASNPNSPGTIMLFDPRSGWQQGAALPGSMNFIGLSGLRALYGTAGTPNAWVADFQAGGPDGPFPNPVTGVQFNTGVGNDPVLNCDGSDGICGAPAASGVAVALFDLSTNPPTQLGGLQSGLAAIGSIAVSSFTIPAGSAGPPVAQIGTPPSFTTAAGTTSTLDAPVANNGATALKLAIASSSPFTAEIANLWVPALQAYPIPITFAPAVAGNPTGSVTLRTNDPNNATAAIPVSGSSSRPGGQATWNTTRLDFKEVPVGSSQRLRISVKNRGSSDLAVTGVSIQQTVQSWFADQSSLTVPSGGTGTIDVTFHPSDAVTYSGYVVFQTSDGQSANVQLSGTGVQPEGRVTWAPNRIDFGNVVSGTTSGYKQIWVANTGTGSLQLSNIAWPADCTDVQTGTVTVPSGHVVAVSAKFNAPAPTGGFSWSGTLTFDTTDPAQPTVQVPLAAELSGGGQASWAPHQIDFGKVLADPRATSGYEQVVVTNTGVGDLLLTNIEWPADCRPPLGQPSSATIPSGQTFAFGAELSGPSGGPHWSGTLTFNTTDPKNATVQVPLVAEIVSVITTGGTGGTSGGTSSGGTTSNVTGRAGAARQRTVTPRAGDGVLVGQVTNVDGLPLRGLQVFLTASDGSEHQTRTITAGQYSFTSLSQGQYTLVAGDQHRDVTIGLDCSPLTPEYVHVRDARWVLDLRVAPVWEIAQALGISTEAAYRIRGQSGQLTSEADIARTAGADAALVERWRRGVVLSPLRPPGQPAQPE